MTKKLNRRCIINLKCLSGSNKRAEIENEYSIFSYRKHGKEMRGRKKGKKNSWLNFENLRKPYREQGFQVNLKTKNRVSYTSIQATSWSNWWSESKAFFSSFSIDQYNIWFSIYNRPNLLLDRCVPNKYNGAERERFFVLLLCYSFL